MTIKVVIDDGTGVQYHYTMQAPAEQMLAEFGEGKWPEIVMVEDAPEIRRNLPMRLTIRREKP